MTRRTLLLLTALAPMLGACSADQPAPDPDALRPDPRLRSLQAYGTPLAEPTRRPLAAKGFNSFIINAAHGFGQAAYLWAGDGVTRELTYQGTVIATPHTADRCHCVGATFQTYITAFEAWDAQLGGQSGSLKGLSVAQVKQLKQTWYVATSDESGSQGALVNAGLGTKVSDWSQAQQGDPVQIWRNDGSGHSVIFDSWVKDGGGNITGLHYFSCQSSGAGFNSETIGSGAGQVNGARLYITHPLAPGNVVPDAAPAMPDQAPAAADQGSAARDSAAPADSAPTAADAAVPSGPGTDPLNGGCAVAAGPAGTGAGLVLAALALVVLCWRRGRINARRGRCPSRWR